MDTRTANEQVLVIPSHSVKKKYGVSMDFGNSALKVAYATETDDGVSLHFATYRSDALSVALKDIKERIGDNLVGEEDVVMTGTFCGAHTSEIDSTLGIKSKNSIETDCFVKGFIFLMENFPLRELVHPKDAKVQAECKKISDVMNVGMKQMAVGHMQPLWCYNNEPQIESLDEHKLQYPAVLAMCGSACGIIKVINKDGDYEAPDLTPISGRTLLGAGSFLAGTKSFQELVELAEKGSTLKVDTVSSDFDDIADDNYAEFSMDMEIFTWGKAAEKDLDSFTREDRAAAAISVVAESMASYTHQWAHMCDVKHIYFCGGLHSTAVVREKLEKYFTVRAKRYPLGYQSRGVCTTVYACMHLKEPSGSFDKSRMHPFPGFYLPSSHQSSLILAEMSYTEPVRGKTPINHSKQGTFEVQPQFLKLGAYLGVLGGLVEKLGKCDFTHM